MTTNENFEKKIDILYTTILNEQNRDIEREISRKLDRCGLMYRTFSRIKPKESTKKKIEKKREKYIQSHKKCRI